MQLMIDTAHETPAALRLAASFLMEHATLKEGAETEARTVPNAFVPPASLFVPPPPPSNVVPLVPPPPASLVPPPPPLVPPAPPAAPAASTVVPPVAPAASVTPVPPAPGSSSTEPLLLDSAGMPWDARVHQKGKSKKKDGTWKLQKNIDAALVSSVTQELHARMQALKSTAPSVDPAAVFGRTPLPAGAVAPVSLPIPPPPTPQAPQGAIPPAPGAQEGFAPPPFPPGQVPGQGQAPQAPVSLQQPSVPVPPAPFVGMPDAGNPGVVPTISFRDLVAKITAARNYRDAAGNPAPRLTADQVTQIVLAAGAPSLQMLNSMVHLVPAVDFAIDMALATA